MFVCMWMYRVKMRAVCTTKPCTTGVCVRVCACTVKMRAMSPKCMAKPCATGLCVYVFVQSEDQNYAQNVYHQAMYSWLLSAYACSEWRRELCPWCVPRSHVLWVSVCMCLYRVKMRAMPPTCTTKPCTTGPSRRGWRDFVMMVPRMILTSLAPSVGFTGQIKGLCFHTSLDYACGFGTISVINKIWCCCLLLFSNIF